MHIAELLASFRAKGVPIIHIRHASLKPDSRFHVDRPGYAVKEEAREHEGEPVIVKHVNSAFIGTDLEARLRKAVIDTMVIVGATTNHCVETTTRMAGNLGFNAKLVRDATWTFDREGVDGETISTSCSPWPVAIGGKATSANMRHLDAIRTGGVLDLKRSLSAGTAPTKPVQELSVDGPMRG
jgi:hypothetical protein